jgi:hypothetical protein
VLGENLSGTPPIHSCGQQPAGEQMSQHAN